MDKIFITNTYAEIGTWRPYTIRRHSLYSNNLLGGLHCTNKVLMTCISLQSIKAMQSWQYKKRSLQLNHYLEFDICL